MYHAMAEPQRIREVLLYSAGIILSIDVFVMIIGYYYFAQTTLAPGKKLSFPTFISILVANYFFFSLCNKVTLNIGNHLIPSQKKFEYVLKAMTSLGVISNLQVTCMIMILALRDSLIQAMGIPVSYSKLVSASIVFLATVLALLLQTKFAVTCSFIGSLTVFTNSLILPIVFFHLIAGKDCSTSRWVFHLLMFSVAAISFMIGIYNNFVSLSS
jgi:hypothetical protein